MGLPQIPSPPSQYPKEIQLKLYQSFIFSIPILFSIILFLLFYLFYLKRRASNISSSPSPTLPFTSNLPTQFNTQVELKGDLQNKLTIITFDEELRAKNLQCCVCLGEYEMKEELQQIPACKHVFHIECIHHWLNSNLTCPLCRCSIFPTKKPATDPGSPLGPFNLFWQTNSNSNYNHPQQVLGTSEQQLDVVVTLSEPNLSSEEEEEPSRQSEEPSRGESSCLTQLGGSQESSTSTTIDDRNNVHSNGNSVVIQIQTPSS